MSDNEVAKNIVEYENMMREGGESAKSAVDAYEGQEGSTGVWDSEIKAYMDSATLKGLFFSETWVYILVDLVANKISSVPMRVMRGETIDGKFTKKPAEGHPLQDLIENPNPFQSYPSWMYCTVAELTLLGNSIQWYAPQSNVLMALPTESIRMNVAPDGKVSSYVVAEVHYEEGFVKGTKATQFNVDDIVHIRRPNPSSLLWGLSPFIPGRKSILFNRYSQDYLNSFYQKGAMPGFALEMDKEANERVAMRLIRSFENAYTGRRNMRRTMLLPKGVSLKEVSHSLANQDLATYIDKNREDIINLLKVPKHELSLQESGSLGSEEAKTSLKNFWHATLIPMMKMIEGELTKFYRRRGQIEGVDTFLEFDYTQIDALSEDLGTKATIAKQMLDSGWTINEVRTKVWELDPSTAAGTDDPYLIKPAASPFGGGGGGFGLGLSMPAPAPAAPALPAPSAAPLEDRDATALVSKAAKDKVTSFLKGGNGWWSRREAQIREDAAKGIHLMEKATLKMFADMAVAIIKTVKSHLKEKGWDEYLTKAAGDDEAGPKAKLVAKEELRRRLRKSLDKFEEVYIDDVREALIARMDVGYDAALIVPFNLPSELESAGLKVRGEQVRQDALEARASRAFRYLNETTVADVYNTIDKGIDEGRTVQQIAEDLRARFSDIAEIGSRAMTIARTETLTAVSLGQAAAMTDAATVIPDLKKMWISADDDRVRDSHDALHGDVVPYDQSFKNGLDFPRDPSGPAEEVINCRCSWIMVPADQMANIDDSLAAEEESK